MRKAGAARGRPAPTLKALVCLGRQEAAALLQQEPAGRGGEVLRAADGSPGGDPRRDHPAALQAAGQQAVGAVTQPAALGPALQQVELTSRGRTFGQRGHAGMQSRTRAPFPRLEGRAYGTET